jgi:hypothetical protein
MATAYVGAADFERNCGRSSGPEVLRAMGSERTNFAPVTTKQKLAFDDERCAPIIRSSLFTTKTLHDGGVLTLAMTIYQKKKFYFILFFPMC